MRSLLLKLNSDLGVALGLEMRLSRNVRHLLDLAKGLDLNLCTDLTLTLRLKLRKGLGLELRLRGSHRSNRRDREPHMDLHRRDWDLRHLLHGHDGRVLDVSLSWRRKSCLRQQGDR